MLFVCVCVFMVFCLFGCLFAFIFLAGFFNEKFRLIVWHWSGGRAASTIKLKFCFLTITQMFFEWN